MKTIIISALFIAGIFVTESYRTVPGTKDHATSVSPEKKSVRKRKPGEPTGKSEEKGCWRGVGYCGWCIAEYPENAGEQTPRVFVELLNDHQLLIDNDYNYHNEDGDVLNLTNESVYLPASMAAFFEKASVHILPGTYTTDYSSNPYGSMIVNVECN